MEFLREANWAANFVAAIVFFVLRLPEIPVSPDRYRSTNFRRAGYEAR